MVDTSRVYHYKKGLVRVRLSAGILYLVANAIVIVMLVASSVWSPKVRADTPYNASSVLGQTDGNGSQVFDTSNQNNKGVSADGLNDPLDNTLDSTHHRLFVADSNNNRVVVYQLDNQDTISSQTAINVLGQPNFNDTDCANPSQNSLCTPLAVAYDSVSNLLFVADSGAPRVLVYDLSGGISNGMNAAHVIGQPDFGNDPGGTSQNVVSFVNQLSYDPADNFLFVTDGGNSRVLVYDLSGGITDGMNASNVLGQADFNSNSNSGCTTAQTSLCQPSASAYDPVSKRLFISDTFGNRVMVYDLSGGITNGMNASNVLGQTDFSSNGCAVDQAGICSPMGLAYDPTDDNLLVPNFGNRISVYDLSGGITDDMNASHVLGQADFSSNNCRTTNHNLCSPVGITYDPTSSSLFVTDSINQRIMSYDLSGGITDGMNASHVLGQTVAGQPSFISASQNDTNPSAVGMSGPTSTLLDSANHRLFVADGNNTRVLVYQLDNQDNISSQSANLVLGEPNFDTYAQGSCVAVSQNSVCGQVSLAYDSSGDNLFVDDSQNNRILVYDLSGGITDGMNASHVLGQANFSSNGGGASQVSLQGLGGLYYDQASKILFVADSGNSRVVTYDLSGGITDGMNASHVLGQADFSGNGCNVTQDGMCDPADVFYDSTLYKLFVADSGNNRVLVYDLSGGITDGMNASHVLGQADFSGNGCNVTQDGMCNPAGLSYAQTSEMLFVSDGNNNRVLTYSLSSGVSDGMNASGVLGQPNFTLGTPNVTQQGLSSNQKITFDNLYNRLFVTDSNNSRILQFNFAKLTTSVPSGQTGASYSTSLGTQTQGTTNYSLVSGSLPSGLSLNNSTGVIGGTPKTPGTFNFTVSLADDNGVAGIYTDNTSYSINIANTGTNSGSTTNSKRKISGVASSSDSSSANAGSISDNEPTATTGSITDNNTNSTQTATPIRNEPAKNSNELFYIGAPVALLAIVSGLVLLKRHRLQLSSAGLS